MSFASEDRVYVERVAAGLKAAGVRFFFADHEKTVLWGEDLAVRFDRVFRTSARYVVPFVSRHYATKAWSGREFHSALARAVHERGLYILPVRFDDTELPGLLPTIVYIDGRKESPGQVVARIVEKLGRRESPEAPVSARTRRSSIPKRQPRDFNPFVEAERALEGIHSELVAHRQELEGHGYVLHSLNRGGRFGLRILADGRVLYSLDMWIGTPGFGENALCFYDGGSPSLGPGATTGLGSIKWDANRGEAVVELLSLSLLDEWGPGKSVFSPEELAARLWQKIVRRLPSSSGP